MKKTWIILTVALAMSLCAQGAWAAGYQPGDAAEGVAVMQKALEDLGLYYADITGHYGERTERAVKLFQKRYGLEQTGVADVDTIGWLNLIAGVDIPLGIEETTVENTAPGASGAVTVGGVTTLRNGMSSEAVRKLQEDLTTLGFYTGSITGHFGDLTQEAVRLFQRAQDISSDGIAGPQTLSRIEAEMALRNQPVVEPIIPPQVIVPSVPSVPSAPSQTYAPISLLSVEMISVGQTLRYGDYSDQVTRLQKALCALGYLNAAPSGYFDMQTEIAVMAYQGVRGMAVDGVAGYRTITSINGDVLDGIAQLLGTGD